MRTRLTSRLSLLFLSFAMVLAIPAVAFADIVIVNDVNVGVGNASKAPGDTGIANVWLEPTNNDPARDFNGCNVGVKDDGVKATVTLKSSDVNKVYFGTAANPSDTTTTQLDVCDTDLASGLQTSTADNEVPYTVASGAASGTTATISVTNVTGGLNSQNGNQTSQYVTTDTLIVNITAPAKQNQTITFNQPTAQTYGAADFALGATASSNLAVSYSSSTTGVCTIVDAKVHVVSAGDCTVTASQAGNASYNSATPVSKTFVIGKADLTVVTDDQTRKYGEANPTLTGSVDGLQYSDNITASRSTTAIQNSDVGNYPIAATLSDPGSKLGNYNVTNNGGTLSVTKATATISLSNLNGHTYDGTAKAATATTIPASLNGVSITYGGQPAAPKDAGSYAVVASLSNPNYEADNARGTLNIAKKALSVTANSDSREYGDANPDLTGTLSGVVNGDNITASYSTAAARASNVGTYAIVPSLGDPNSRLANYDLTETNGTLTVTKAPITIKANDDSREYGDANPAFSGSIVSGLKNNDALSVSGSSAANAGSDVGSYAIVPGLSGAKASNYEVSAQNGTLTVTKAPLSAKANNDSREYGETNPTFTGTLSGVKNNDPVSASYSTAAARASNVGTYAIVPSINATASVLSNYQQPQLTNGTLTVTKAPLSAKATNATKVYGDALGAADLTGTLSGVKNDDPIAVSYSSAGAAASSDVGDYVIVPALDATAAVLSNYGDPVLTNGTLSVTKAPLVIKADDTSRFYGDPNPAFTGSVVSGLKNNDVLNLSFTTMALQNSPVGTYAIVPEAGGAKAGNYLVSARNGVLTVGSWTFKGFYQPVDMSGTLNTVKGGSTVPIKFELFKGATELTDTASINQPLRATKVACESGATVDEIELVAAGATALRYDATGGQFVYNWKTPTGTGTCYKVTITANDGSSQTAHFKLK
jgi:MBG domain-containing protein